MLAAADCGFALDDLSERSADMECSRRAALRRPPRNGVSESPVYFEDSRPVLESGERVSVSGWKTVSRELKQLARCDIEQNGARRWQLGKRSHGCTGLDASTELSKV
jgi:hypothetical protein